MAQLGEVNAFLPPNSTDFATTNNKQCQCIHCAYETVELMHKCCSQHPCTGATTTEEDGKQEGQILRSNEAYKNIVISVAK